MSQPVDKFLVSEAKSPVVQVLTQVQIFFWQLGAPLIHHFFMGKIIVLNWEIIICSMVNRHKHGKIRHLSWEKSRTLEWAVFQVRQLFVKTPETSMVK